MGRAKGPGIWLAFRVGLAIGLTVLFYVAALGLAVGLLLLAWWSVEDGERFDLRLLISCTVGAGAILYATFPRRDRFPKPGPLLRAEEHARLFAVLRSVARATGQPMPAEVYLVPDVNAGVLQRGGVLGFGGRRVMVLGFPLLAAMRVSEFRGVLAHEFGHYSGGETSFGPWIYRTQEAIGRTVRTLGEAGSWLHFLFLWYGKAFLRITLAVSRRQELAADSLAAEIAGAPAIADGLRRVHGAAAAFQAYFGSEVAPVLGGGFRPPVFEGFRRFLAVSEVSTSVAAFVDAEAKQGKGDPYDSHPPLGARLAALGNPPPVPPSPQDPLAASLLEAPEDLEAELLGYALTGGTLPPRVPWEEVAEKVYVPAWRKELDANRSLLRGLTAGGLPALLSRPAGDPRRKGRGAPAPETEGLPKAGGVAAMAILLHLLERGWALETAPGRPIVLLRGDDSFFPFREIEDLHGGRTSAAGWTERCRLLGIADLALDTVGRRSEGAS
jgi:Zn-dependent protease with chaperone function